MLADRRVFTSILIAVVAAPLVAQQPTFRAGVDLVPVDVSVLNKSDRSPVRGLTAADFTVLEDGRPQPIVVFTPVEVAPPTPLPSPDDPGAWTREVARDVTSNDYSEAPENRLFILYVDDAMLPPDPATLKSVKDVARHTVDQLGLNDRMAVVYALGSGQAQGFTADRGKLLLAVNQIPPGQATYTFGWEAVPPRGIAALTSATGNPPPGLDPDLPLMQASLQTLERIADALLATPSRRKVLIYVGMGLPLNVSAGAATSTVASGPVQQNRAMSATIAARFIDLFREMQRANIVVYPISPAGVGGIEDYITRQVRARAPQLTEYQQTSNIDPRTGLPVVQPCNNAGPQSGACFTPFAEELGHLYEGFRRDFLLMTAENTGGVATVYTNDFARPVEHIFDENSWYYLLGYRPPDPRANGALHRLEVKVNRKNTIVRTRNLYEAERPTKFDKTGRPIPPPPPLLRATAGVLPIPDLPMDVSAVPIALAGKPEAAVALTVGLHHLAVPSRVKETIDLQISAFTPDGQPRGSVHQSADVVLVPNRVDDTTRYELLSRIDLKPGRYQLRIAAHRHVADMTGSVYVDVDVPDFSKDKLSASGVAIAMTPTPEASPRDLLTPFFGVVPTAARVFERRGRATAVMRLYEGGSDAIAAVSLMTRVLDARGRALSAGTRTIGPQEFGSNRATDVRFDVPLLSLSPGDYLLTFEATLDKHVVRRDVRFSTR